MNRRTFISSLAALLASPILPILPTTTEKPQYHIGVDPAVGEDYGCMTIIEAWKNKPATVVQTWWWTQDKATGNYYWEKISEAPSLHWHGQPPFVMVDTGDWPW